MSTISGARRASGRQGRSADKVVVNLDMSSQELGSRRGVSTSSTGARTSPIDVEALDDEVQAILPSQVPPQRNGRIRRQPVTVVDLEVDASQEGNKRRRVAPVINISPETGEGSSLQVLFSTLGMIKKCGENYQRACKGGSEGTNIYLSSVLEQVGGALHNNMWSYLLHKLHQAIHPGPEEMPYLPKELENEQFPPYLPSKLCCFRVRSSLRVYDENSVQSPRCTYANAS
ncbi:uncharacterized protein LOC100839348 isoform X1 [Brachypodium distachyon]|uniref:uncharacterized protein LOC100839348 isoform X1 n=1 Tax=Brachypodium distachyon TaxID=15368 RepID=UPI000D0E029E|nr:uncharacterized protein LOC100839348 isoform X1 [Brachypodium distachyon]XP_024318686.1 uncharacterized protein LOC100839348 isoform X1 [Brachypodium distachyon]|eukprot:XP_024318685.1 uncharacterized protein LOC100839348 isoform X1 [Brachypodium distachyon]